VHSEYHGGAGENGADDLHKGDGGHDIGWRTWSIHGEWREGEERSGDMQKKKKRKR
jgi:hypothetical protein